MNVCDDCGECDYEYGDRVRLVQNHMLTGQVIGEKNWGQEYLVRLGATVSSLWFERVELEPDDEFYGPRKSETPPVADENEDAGNVINAAALFASRTPGKRSVH